MSDDLILRPDAKGGQTSSVSLEFIHCELADEMDLIAADPCDAWVLAWYAAYSATHFVVNQAAQAYYDDIVTKWGDKAWNDWQRCLGLPYDPGPPPEDAVHFSISTKGVSGGAGGGDSGSGLKDAQIINFGDQSIQGDSSCSSIPRTVFCEPGLSVFVNHHKEWNITRSAADAADLTLLKPAPGLASLSVTVSASVAIAGEWAEFTHIPNMRYGSELVQVARIANDSIVFKSGVTPGLETWPYLVLHYAVEARCVETGIVKTTGVQQQVFAASNYSANGISGVQTSLSAMFSFTQGESGTWEFYFVPLMLLLQSPHQYHYENSDGLYLTGIKQWNTQGVATYSPGAAGEKTHKYYVGFKEDWTYKFDGLALVEILPWQDYLTSSYGIIYSARASIYSPIAGRFSALVQCHKMSAANWNDVGYINAIVGSDEQPSKIGRRCGLHLESLYYLKAPSFPHNSYSDAPPDTSGVGYMDITPDLGDVEFYEPTYLGSYTETVTVLGQTMPKFLAVDAFMAANVNIKAIGAYENPPGVFTNYVLTVSIPLASILTAACESIDATSLTLVKGAFANYEFSANTARMMLDFSRPACLSAIEAAVIAAFPSQQPYYTFVRVVTEQIILGDFRSYNFPRPEMECAAGKIVLKKV